MARLFLPVGITVGAFWALTRKDYYEEALDKHLAWITFHGALGACLANGVKLAFKVQDPRRYVFQDTFVLLAYSFGYSLVPYLLKDQVSQLGENNLSRALANRDIMRICVELSGISGVFYALFLLKVTKLGFKMNDVRSWRWMAFVFIVPIVVPTLLSELLIKKG